MWRCVATRELVILDVKFQFHGRPVFTPGDWKREVCHWMACTWAMTLNLADSFLTSKRGEHHDCQEERDCAVWQGIVPIMEPYGGYTYTETSPSFGCVFSAKDCRRYCLVAIVAIVIRSYEKWVGWKVEGQELEIGTIPQVVRWWLRKQVPSSLDIRWIVWGPKVLGTTVAAEYVYTCIYIYISCYFLYYA